MAVPTSSDKFGNGLRFGFKIVSHPKIAFSCRPFVTPTSQALRSISITESSTLLRPGLPPLSDTNLVSEFPACILPIESEFTCSLKQPTMNSAPLNPGCDVASNQLAATLITDTIVTACFSHPTLPLRGFIMDSFSVHFS